MSAPWEEYQTKNTQDSAESSGPWDEYKNAPVTPTAAGTGPVAPVDNSKYENSGISTFLANAINSATFGLPDYLNKTFTPDSYAEGQRYNNANPLAANTGDIAGTVAGYAVPIGAGIKTGAKIGSMATDSILKRFAPEIAAGNFAPLARLYGKLTGAATGGQMGAQVAGAAPGIIEGNPGKAVAGAELVGQYGNMIPGVSPLGGITSHIVPGVAGVTAEAMKSAQEAIAIKNKKDLLRMQMQTEAAKRIIPFQSGPQVPGQF
jgi:hypothetical protein